VQKLINDPGTFVDDMLGGILAAHGDALRYTEDRRAIVRCEAPLEGKVGIVTGGGSGHLPLFLGYVGSGLADGVAVGNVFASPSAEPMLSAMRAVNSGKGVLQLYGNYGGDVMNFGLAADLAEAEGIEAVTILGADDVASAPPGEEARRRGIAGIFFLYKIAGAAAAAGLDLQSVARVTQHTAACVRSMGVALSPCIVPAAGRATFELPPGQMELGMGIHGEPGVRRGPLEPADAVTDQLLDAILSDLPFVRGDAVDVLVNGLGATPREELYIVYQRVSTRLDGEGIRIRRRWIGEYATALEMAGASISLLRIDDELARYMDAPASSPLLGSL
jgi:dihydroxyacetone kinase